MKSLGILVLGMHRGGTSALAGSLAALGVHMGETLLDAIKGENDRGFWENQPVVEIHDRLLASLRTSWDDPRPLPADWLQMPEVDGFRQEIIQALQDDCLKYSLWGLKDPRLCKLLPLWLEILQELEAPCVFVHIHRHPAEVALSLERRNGFSQAKSGLLWVEHNLNAEKWTRGQQRIFISYDQLLADPVSTASRISTLVDNNHSENLERNNDDLLDFISSDLRHHSKIPNEQHAEFGDYASIIAETHQTLLTACESETADVLKCFDELGQVYDDITSAFTPVLTSHVVDLQAQIEGLQTQIIESQRNIDRIVSSFSWKVTKPLRGPRWMARRIITRR
jgi:hypothetical protein